MFEADQTTELQVPEPPVDSASPWGDELPPSVDSAHDDEAFLSRRPSEMVRKPPPVKFGAIDVGTNSIHLVMVEVSPEGDFRILGRDKEMVQLGRAASSNTS